MILQDGELIRKRTVTTLTPSTDLINIIQNKNVRKITVSNFLSSSPIAPVAAGSTKTLAATNGAKTLLNTATGSVVTLPAATGSGVVLRFITTTTVTSNSHKILAASSSDSFQGTVFTEDAGTATGWYAAISSTFHSLQMNGSTTSGFQGDSFEFVDVATNVWEVTGMTKSTGTAATPFSTATS